MRKARTHVPIRTCIACGRKDRKDVLIRLIVGPGNRLVGDARKDLPGRGAYVCNDKCCLERLPEPGRLKRAFRTDQSLSVDPLFGLEEGGPL